MRKLINDNDQYNDNAINQLMMISKIGIKIPEFLQPFMSTNNLKTCSFQNKSHAQ